MQRFPLLLTALVPLLTTAGVGGSLEPYYKAASDCVKYLGISESRLEKYNRLVFPPDRDTMCFVRCVGLVLELWDDHNGTYWCGHKQFNPVTDQQIRHCIQSKLAIIDLRDLCSRAYYSLRCFRKHIRNVMKVDDVGDPPTDLQIGKDDALGVSSDVEKVDIKNELEDSDDVLGDDRSDNGINTVGVRSVRPGEVEFVTVDGPKNDRAIATFEEIDIVGVNHGDEVVVVDNSYSHVPPPGVVVAAPKVLSPPVVVPAVEVIHRTEFVPLTASQVIQEISKCMDECGVSTLNLCAATEPLRDIPPIHCVTHCAALRTNVYCDRRGPLLENLYVQLGRCESEHSFRRRLELCFRRRCQPPGTCPQAIAYRQFITCVQSDYERFFSSHASELVQLPIFTKFCW